MPRPSRAALVAGSYFFPRFLVTSRREVSIRLSIHSREELRRAEFVHRAASPPAPALICSSSRAALPNPGTEPLQLASNQDMAVVDDSDAVSRFEAALAAHRRLNAREDALADAQRAALERAESHDLAPPTPPVQASELQQLLDEFEAHAPAEETKGEKPPPKVTKGSGGGVYGRAARRNANQGTSRTGSGDPGPALEAISDAAATAARVTGDGLELAAKGVAVAAGATVAVSWGRRRDGRRAAVEGAKVAGPAIRDAANATRGDHVDAVEAAGPILQDAADASRRGRGPRGRRGRSRDPGCGRRDGRVRRQGRGRRRARAPRRAEGHEPGGAPPSSRCRR